MCRFVDDIIVCFLFPRIYIEVCIDIEADYIVKRNKALKLRFSCYETKRSYSLRQIIILVQKFRLRSFSLRFGN